MQTKICSQCKIKKELSNFYKQLDCKFGVDSQCKECKKQSDNKRYHFNNTKKLHKCKEYYEQNKERVLLRQKNNPNTAKNRKIYYKLHKNELSEYDKKYKQTHKLQHKNTVLKSKYGITLKQYVQMLEEQNGVCAICGNKEKVVSRSLAVDHSHKSGKVRGLLCSNCNTMLGKTDDNKTVLQSAINYLNLHKD